LPDPSNDLLESLYGERHRLCPTPNPALHLVLSLEREIDLIELEQLCDAVGWSRRPLRRVRKALQHSLLCVGLWHAPILGVTKNRACVKTQGVWRSLGFLTGSRVRFR
jgi:hypothetical protein